MAIYPIFDWIFVLLNVVTWYYFVETLSTHSLFIYYDKISETISKNKHDSKLIN